MDEHLVARAGVHQRDLDRAPRPAGVLAEREPSGLVDLEHPHRDPDVAARDALHVGVATHARQAARLHVSPRHSIRLALSSSSSCSYSAPMPFRRSSVACASSSSTWEIANPTWMSTQSPAPTDEPSVSKRPMFTLR